MHMKHSEQCLARGNKDVNVVINCLLNTFIYPCFGEIEIIHNNFANLKCFNVHIHGIQNTYWLYAPYSKIYDPQFSLSNSFPPQVETN